MKKPASHRPLRFEPLEARQLLTTVTLVASADTFLRSGQNNGAATVLDSRFSFVPYIQFDLSTLNIDEISAATLTVSKVASARNDSINGGRFAVYGLADVAGNTPQNWSEATLVAGMNSGAEWVDDAALNGIDRSRLVSLDAEDGANVTEIIVNGTDVPQMLTGPDLIAFLNSRVDDNGLATFVIPVEATGGLGYGLASKEHANEILRPKLELTFTEKAEDPEDPPPPVATPPRQVEALDRGMVAVRRATSQVYVGWRMLATDPADVAFNLYRSANGGAPVKLNATPLVQTTDFVDTTASLSATNTYFVRPVIAGVELAANGSHTLPANSPVQQFLNVPLQIPAGGTTPDGVEYTYNANDASVGDLDGDGQYEIILKWDPSNSKDNSQSGYTGNVYIDAYKLDGTLMWRIDLGRNIRAGAHYTQLLVYDFDGDGKAEVVMKTAPGTIDGQGNDVLLAGHSAGADYRNSSGYILSGPEYLTVFNGETGAAMATVPFEPARGSASQWGDTYGNRVDRFTAGVAYLDGEQPSIVFGRGYYGPQSSGGQARNEVTAYDFRDGQLTLRWHFKAGYNINGNINGEYVSQGAHSLTIGDVDGDGKDEIVYGAAVINHDGTGLYSTTWGHGDALHMSDMDPSRPGLEIFMVHESPGSYQGNGATFRDAATGELIFGIPATNDVGRGVAADIDPNSPGYEMWATTSDPDGGPRYVYSAAGQQLYQTPSNMFYNFLVWWDADLSRELLDGTTISKWNSPGRSNFDLDPATGGTQQFAPNAASNNGTKSTPALVADILGDWREEVIWRRGDNTALMIFTTVIPSTTRLTTLMHDTQYRTAIAWQNGGYNQPPHPSFFLGTGMAPPPTPNIYAAAANPLLAADFNQDGAVDGADLGAWGQTYGMTTTHGFLPGDADGDQVVTGSDFLAWQRSFGQSSVAAAVASATAPPALVDEAFATLAGDGLPGSADDEATEAELAGDLIAVAAAYDDGSSGDESADEEAARRRRSDVGVSTLRAGRLRCESPDADSEEFQSAGVAGNFRSFVSTGRHQ